MMSHEPGRGRYQRIITRSGRASTARTAAGRERSKGSRWVRETSAEMNLSERPTRRSIPLGDKMRRGAGKSFKGLALALILSAAYAAMPVYALLAQTPVQHSAGEGESGYDLYHRACAGCHGRDVIAGGIFPDLRQFKGSDGDFLAAVKEGRSGTLMPAWEKVMTDREIERIRTYVKNISADQSPEPEVVTKE